MVQKGHARRYNTASSQALFQPHAVLLRCHPRAGTPRPAHPISAPAVSDFVNSAQDGVVLAAFGTVYGPTLRPEDVIQLAQGFAALAPTRVLWALKPSALRPGVQISDLPLGSNTLVVPWVDYNVSGVGDTR
jgi:hypothetical protein